jgi:uncharacterized glyoxalase superfamily protein PhnB
MPVVERLGGVLLYTTASRFSAMRTFYLEALGLTPRSDRPGFVNFELGDQRLTVAVHSEIDCTNQDALHVMVNFITPDAGAAWTALLDHGAEAVRAPSPESWGGLVGTVRDPDGNMVQLLQLPSPAPRE